jgi:hypothetical protein
MFINLEEVTYIFFGSNNSITMKSKAGQQDIMLTDQEIRVLVNLLEGRL